MTPVKYLTPDELVLLYPDAVDRQAAYLHTLASNPGPAQPPRWARVVPPPRQSRRALARAGVMWSPEVQRYETRAQWLPAQYRRELAEDAARLRAQGLDRFGGPAKPAPRPDRRERRAIGAGPWPRLRRRAEAARRARA